MWPPGENVLNPGSGRRRSRTRRLISSQSRRPIALIADPSSGFRQAQNESVCVSDYRTAAC
jgi:hypothetical protein